MSTTPHSQETLAMSILRSQQAPGFPLESALAPFGVEIVEEGVVRRYLEDHPDLFEAVAQVCDSVRREFGPEASLSLKVYRDPEIVDEHLALYVRLAAYPADTMRRIWSLSEQHEALLADRSGFFLVTTDFRPLR